MCVFVCLCVCCALNVRELRPIAAVAKKRYQNHAAPAIMCLSCADSNVFPEKIRAYFVLFSSRIIVFISSMIGCCRMTINVRNMKSNNTAKKIK